MLEELLKSIVAEKKQQGVEKTVILNYLKEYIQYLTLSFLFNHKTFKKLVFKGGSCLRICYRLPRLSEDLDFDFDKKSFPDSLLEQLDEYLGGEIRAKYFSSLETKIQSTVRLYLKFPILYRLGLARKPETDKLYVKVETEAGIALLANFELTPVSRFGFNFMVNHYDLPSLMSGKIHAVLHRLWFKGSESDIDVNGRDFYDLFWFLENKVSPNWKMLVKTTGIKNEKQLKSLLKRKIEQVITPQKLSYDLKNFIADRIFVEDFSKNYLQIIKKYLE